MLNKIACSYYNTIAIDQEGDLYVWGSAQSGLLGNGITKAVEIPKKFDISKINPFYKAIHVSCAANHAAVIVSNKFLDDINKEKYILGIHQRILKKHKKYFESVGIDLVEQLQLDKHVKIKRDDFAELLRHVNAHIEFTPEEEDESMNIIDYFIEDIEQDEDGQQEKEELVNLAQYVYCVDNNYFKSNRILIWGMVDNGRLGTEQLDDIDASRIATTNNDDISGTMEMGKQKDKFREPQELDRYYVGTKSFPLEPIKKVCCGAKFTLAIDFKGRVFAWGKGGDGCLGNNDLKDKAMPQLIDPSHFGTNSENFIVDIACGAQHCLAINSEGDLYSWGNGKFGKLGHNNEKSELVPKKVRYFVKQRLKVISISAGERHSAAISEKNELYTWGNGSNYRLGHGLLSNEYQPKLVTSLAEYYVSRVSCGANHTVAVTTDGHVYTWGSGLNGRLGINVVSENDQMLPTRVGTLDEDLRKQNFVEVFAGPYQTFALTDKGRLFAWGATKFFTLGIPDVKGDIFTPQLVNPGNFLFWYEGTSEEESENENNIKFDSYELEFQKFLDENNDPYQIAKVFCGEVNTVFLMSNGDIYISGSGINGQLCISPEKLEEVREGDKLPSGLFYLENDDHSKILYSYTPMYLAINLEVKFKYVAVGANHIIAITLEGKAYSWGKNTEGQLGHGQTSKYVTKPTIIEEVNLKKFRMAAASITYSALLSEEGEVWVFGTAEHGCMGISSIKQNYDALVPKLINDIPPMKYIACGPQHMAAITADGKLWTWGNNNNGRLGQGDYTDKVPIPRPATVDEQKGVPHFTMVGCGYMHTIALDSDGHIWGTGVRAYAGFPSSNNYKTFEEEREFKMLPDIKKYRFLHISVAEFHTLAIRTTREIYGWGKSEYGKLAQDTFVSVSDNDQLKNIILPKKIEKLSDMMYVAAGANHSYGLNRNREAFGWGCAIAGRLGISKEDMKLLLSMNLMKNEDNVLVLKQPQELKFSFRKEENEKMEKIYIKKKTGSSYRYARAINEKKEFDLNKNEFKTSFIGIKDDDNMSDSSHGSRKLSKKQFTIMPSNTTGQTNSDETQHQTMMKTTTLVGRSSNLSSVKGQTTDSIQSPKETVAQQMDKRTFIPNPSTFARKNDTNKSKMDEEINHTEQQFPKPSFRETTSLGNRIKKPIRLQKLIQSEDPETSETTLIARDIEAEKAIRDLFARLSKKIEDAKTKYTADLTETQSIALTSTYLLHHKLVHTKDLPHTIPSFILQNIQIYEGIITMLYNHPCYLYKILTSGLTDINIVLDWISKIYSSAQDDERTVNLLVSLCVMMLQDELKHYPLENPTLIRLMSLFAKIYNQIFSLQSSNVKFIKEIVEYLVKEVIIGEFYANYDKSQSETDNLSDLFNLDYFTKHKEQIVEKRSQFEETMERCIQFLKRMDSYIDSVMSKPDFIYSGKISRQLRYLHYRIIQEFKNVAEKDNQFQNKMSNKVPTAIRKGEFLVIELFFGNIAHYLINHKNYGILVPKKYAQILSEKNLQSLAIVISKYFSKEDIALEKAFSKINDFIKVNSRSTDSVNNIIRSMTHYDGYDITLDNLQKIVEDSFNFKERYNSKMTVRDLITLQNFIIKNLKSDKIFVRTHSEDPVYIMVNSLEGSQVDVNEFTFDILSHKVNLKINSKLMQKFGDQIPPLYRCNHCQLMCPEFLLRQEDVDQLHNENWKCSKCGGENTWDYFECQNPQCGAYVPQFEYQQRHIFKKFFPIIQKNAMLKDYFLFLKNNYDIYNDEDIVDMLENSVQACIEEETYEKAHNYGLLLEWIRNINTERMGNELPVSETDNLADKQKIKVINKMLADEFDMRAAHKEYLITIMDLINKIETIAGAAQRKLESLRNRFDLIEVRMSGYKGRYNGVNSRAIKKNIERSEEPKLKAKLHMTSKKPFSVFTSEDLVSQKVLKTFLLHGKAAPKILSNLKFYVFYEKFKGFQIKIVFLEDSWLNLFVKCGPWFINEVALDEYIISEEHFLELRRTGNYKAETTLGYVTFYVENLVNILDEVLIKGYIRRIKSDA